MQFLNHLYAANLVNHLKYPGFKIVSSEELSYIQLLIRYQLSMFLLGVYSAKALKTNEVGKKYLKENSNKCIEVVI